MLPCLLAFARLQSALFQAAALEILQLLLMPFHATLMHKPGTWRGQMQQVFVAPVSLSMNRCLEVQWLAKEQGLHKPQLQPLLLFLGLTLTPELVQPVTMRLQVHCCTTYATQFGMQRG
jgi:hypothetical protein